MDVDDDTKFARALVKRRLGELPPMLPKKDLGGVVRSLQSVCRAKNPPNKLALRALRHAFVALSHDNDGAATTVCPLLHKLASATTGPTGIASDTAAALILLFAHGLGQRYDGDAHKSTSKENLVVLLGFAGGSPSMLRRYADRIYKDTTRENVMIITASEVPEVFEHNIRLVMRAVRGRPWSVHLFSKAGFLTLSRICLRLRQAKARARALQANACVITADRADISPPRAVVWDSSPGSMKDYNEFINGTWQSALLVAKRGSFVFSQEAKLRMDKLLDQFPEAVKESYAPMKSLSPFPFVGVQHLFIFQTGDPVSSAAEIKGYAAGQLPPRDRTNAVLLELKRGTHCDGVWWDGDVYTKAVRDVLHNTIDGR